jgi:beta-glucosidase-like glycosyl hydrolase
VDLGVGGFCVYGGTLVEVADFSRRVQERARSPLLLCADYEDGIASHVVGGTAFPSNMGLGASNDETLAFEKGRLTALEARGLGIGWVFAPVVDLATQPASPIVNIRSFGSDPELVVRMARALAKGMAAGGALSCLKHFPGHGDSDLDSHLDLPLVEAGREVLTARELVPYRALKDDADSVMVGHLAVPALTGDRDTPATLSAAAVSGELRGRLGFQGLVSTDALSMHAVAKRFPELSAARACLLAGCDVLLVPEDPLRLAYDLMRLADSDPAAARAVDGACARLEAAMKTLSGRWAACPPPDSGIAGCASHTETASRMAERCLAWHRPMEGALPRKVAYFEPDEGFPGEVQGGVFLEELKSLGFEIALGADAASADVLVAGLFVSPRAYSGRIAYGGLELERLVKASGRAGRTVAVAFGSPWALAEIPVGAAGLAAFSASSHAQRAAARALARKLTVAGTMPVAIGR